MIIEKMIPKLIDGTPLGISIYSITKGIPHHHPGHMEILYCLKGTVHLKALHEDHTLLAGDIISFDPSDTHYLFSDEENLLVSFYIDLNDPIFEISDLAKRFFVCEKESINKERVPAYKALKQLLLTILYFYCFPTDKSDIDYFKYLAKQLMHALLNNFTFFDYNNIDNSLSGEFKERFNRIQIYINENYNRKITADLLNRQEFLNVNYLSHFLKKTSLLGLPNFVNYTRIYYSDLMLLETDMNIADISYQLGFSDPKFFYRTFKKWYGYTPMKHRQFYIKIKSESVPDTYYSPDDISEALEHHILYQFAVQQLPYYDLSSYTPLRNVPQKFL